ncbi:MAG TPA: hypothetical protein VNH44_16330 [Micropepsaceae bacterium]|nr:hypothetical protein [Micropepsaceae bacterium]
MASAVKAIGPMSGYRSLVLASMALSFPFSAALAQAQAPPARSAKPAEIIRRGPASSDEAPQIDSIRLREERSPGRLYIVQEISFHANKGNARNLHFELVSVSATAPRVTVRDHVIKSPSARQQRGTFIATRFRCGPFQKNYSHVTRATIIDADGERSNSVDFVVPCNLAVIS